MSKYVVLKDTLGANPSYSRGDVIGSEDLPVADFNWLEKIEAVRPATDDEAKRKRVELAEGRSTAEQSDPAVLRDMSDRLTVLEAENLRLRTHATELETENGRLLATVDRAVYEDSVPPTDPNGPGGNNDPTPISDVTNEDKKAAAALPQTFDTVKRSRKNL